VKIDTVAAAVLNYLFTTCLFYVEEYGSDFNVQFYLIVFYFLLQNSLTVNG